MAQDGFEEEFERGVAEYARYFGTGIVFVTCRAVEGELVFGQPATANLLRATLRQIRAEYPFRMMGYVILPDHGHFLIRPAEGVSVQRLVERLKRCYQRDFSQLMGNPATLKVWQRRHEIDAVPDEKTFARRLDQIHYDPVHHGCTARPEEWEQSSYDSWVERGLYKLGWGWQRPCRLL